MASAGSAQIEARGGENWKVVVDGKVVPDYAKVQGEKDCEQYRPRYRQKSSRSVLSIGVLLGVVIAWTLIMTLIGPENVSGFCDTSTIGKTGL